VRPVVEGRTTMGCSSPSGRFEELQRPLGVNDNAVFDRGADQLARVEGEDVAVGLAVPLATRRGQHLGDARIAARC